MIPDWGKQQPSWILSLDDVGAGVVDQSGTGLGVQIVGALQFSRATAGACRLSTGLWNLGVAINAPRAHYAADGTYLGYLSERAATQLALLPRDWTNAAWVKTTLTTAKTSTGIDGVTNSCTRLTATGASSSALQTVAFSVAATTFSCYVKRITGTGTVTLQNEAGTLDITALINSSTFTLVQVSNSTLNDPIIGLTIATSGDAVDVDCGQLEAGTFATSPIPAAGTRGADSLIYSPLFPVVTTTAGSCYGVFTTNFATAPVDSIVAGMNDTNGLCAYVPSGQASTVLRSFDGTNTPSLTSSNARNTMKPFACSWGADFNIIVANGSNTTVYAGDMGNSHGGTTQLIGIGCNPSGAPGKELNGTIKDLQFWNQQLPLSYLQSITQ